MSLREPLKLDRHLSRLIYFDPSGEGSEAKEPIVVVAAVIAHVDDQMRAINADVRKLRELLPSDRRVEFEFKADRLFAHIRKFGDESKYKAVVIEFLKMMRKHEVNIQWSAVHRIGFTAIRKPDSKVSARDMAFLITTLLVEIWFRQKAPNEGGICIADRGRAEKPMHEMVHEFRTIGIPQIPRVSTFDHLVDTITFADSKASTGVQMADFANYLKRLNLMNDRFTEPFFEIIRSLYDRSFNRFAPEVGEVLYAPETFRVNQSGSSGNR